MSSKNTQTKDQEKIKKQNIKSFKQDYNGRELIECNILLKNDKQAKYVVILGEYMGKEGKLEKMVLQIGEQVMTLGQQVSSLGQQVSSLTQQVNDLTIEVREGFKKVNEDIAIIKKDVSEIKEAVIELQDQAKDHGWTIKKTISNSAE